MRQDRHPRLDVPPKTEHILEGKWSITFPKNVYVERDDDGSFKVYKGYLKRAAQQMADEIDRHILQTLLGQSK